jgi:predicted aspartyl protease
MAVHGTTIEKEFTRTSAPILSVTVRQNDLSELTCALIDTGYEGYAFIDKEYAQDKGIELTPLSRPFSLYSYDSAEGDSYTMKEYARCDIQNRDYVDKDVVLYATPLSHYPIVLGHPWLKKHNPKANWADGS